jgi:hypothetical protein
MTDKASHWRLAFMLDSASGDPAALGQDLAEMAVWLGEIAPPRAQIRIAALKAPIAPPPPDPNSPRRFETVDAAIEITVEAAQNDALVDLSARIGEAVRPIVTRGAAMTGPMHRMVPPRDGIAILSLAFQRAPGTTSAEFQRWWRYQHAEVCVPLMTPELLAYDQVHLDHARSRAVAEAAGFVDRNYDAYDNLTWADARSQGPSVRDPKISQLILEDEIGHIDHATYRGNLLEQIYRSW